MYDFLTNIGFDVHQKLQHGQHGIICFVSMVFSLLISNCSFASGDGGNALESNHQANEFSFFVPLIILIVFVTLIRILKLFFQNFCWHCFKRDAIQCTDKVYKQGWLVKSIWTCRFCERKAIRRKTYSNGSSSGGGDIWSGGSGCSGSGDGGCE